MLKTKKSVLAMAFVLGAGTSLASFAEDSEKNSHVDTFNDTMSKELDGKSDTMGVNGGGTLTRKFFTNIGELSTFLQNCEYTGGQAVSPEEPVAPNTFMGLCINK